LNLRRRNPIVKGRSVRRASLLALTALLGLAVVVSGSATASDAGQAVAEVAKKKCKKKKKKKKRARSAEAAKKKGCKKKKATATTRATLTWSPSSVDLDLLAWDTSGLKSPSPGISNTSHSGEVAGGPEVFRDLLSPSSRQFAYGICADSVPTPTTSWTLTVLSASGNTQTASIVTEGAQFDSDGDNYRVTYSNPSSFNPGPGSTGGWCS
jgi:hypothetical protein